MKSLRESLAMESARRLDAHRQRLAQATDPYVRRMAARVQRALAQAEKELTNRGRSSSSE